VGKFKVGDRVVLVRTNGMVEEACDIVGQIRIVSRAEGDQIQLSGHFCSYPGARPGDLWNHTDSYFDHAPPEILIPEPLFSLDDLELAQILIDEINQTD